MNPSYYSKQNQSDNNNQIMSNSSTNHPLINNSQSYMYEQKFVSIHSEDRDIIKYPNACEFDIEMPQEYCNVQAVRLSTWTFPSNFTVFSENKKNVSLSFKITNPYNPGAFGSSDPLLNAIFLALFQNINSEYIIVIEEGSYTCDQMAIELTNKMNNAITTFIQEYLISNSLSSLLTTFNNNGGYNEFVVMFNMVESKLWFGNQSSSFELVNDSIIYNNSQNTCIGVSKNIVYPSYVDWGLPAYLGFTREPMSSIESETYLQFSYLPKNESYWLKPNIDSSYNYLNTSVFYVKAPFKTDIFGCPYFYMELFGLNCIDEMIPYVDSCFTRQSNETNGTLNAAFAKLSKQTEVNNTWAFNNSNELIPSRIFNPPAERIKKLRVKLREHNGQLLDLNNGTFSFMLEFTLYKPQIEKRYNMFVPETTKFSYN